MSRLRQFITALFLASIVVADTFPATRPSTSQVALYLPADPTASDRSRTVVIEVANNEPDRIDLVSGPIWRPAADPSRDDIRERKVGEWRIIMSYRPLSGQPVGGGFGFNPSIEPISIQPGKTALVRVTAPAGFRPTVPFHLQVLLQHQGRTVAASPGATVDWTK